MGERDERQGFKGGGPMIRIGSVGEMAYDVRAEVSQPRLPLLPRPRARSEIRTGVLQEKARAGTASVDNESTARPPAA